jgi:membrane-bound lytic murein transglycosylase B
MAGNALTRKSKALTLVPLALVSAVWTASTVTVGTTATAAKPGTDASLPDGTAVPDKAIEAPASVPVPGNIAPAVPNGASDQVVAGASTSGIPAAALSAYQRAAQIMSAADASCRIPWELVAAIGRVESNHGQYGGNTLTDEGVSKPGIYGPQLNGKNGTQEIRDTDGGELDKDAVFDRAVGPMQFIPSTWQVVKVDADGDGQRDPQDIDDAALAAAVYLCSGEEDLSTRKGQETAVYRYNHSRSYVNLVLRIMEAYSQGDYTAIPSGTYGGNLFTPSYSSAIGAQQQQNATQTPKATGPKGGGAVVTPSSPSTPAAGSGGSGSSGGGSTGGDDSTGGVIGGGDTGGDTGGLPLPDAPKPKDPVSKAVEDTANQVGDAVGSVTQPGIDLITVNEALNLCEGHLAGISGTLKKVPLVGNIYDRAIGECKATLVGEEQSQANDLLGTVPTTLRGVLRWLGL